MNHSIFVTCPKFISPYLNKELEELGYTEREEHVAGILLRGTMLDAMRLNLLLRCAHRVLIEVAHFKAATSDDLYREAQKTAWEDYIPCDGYFSVVSSVDNENIRNSQFAHQKLKDAIVDRIRQHFGRRPDSGPKTDKAVVYLYWKQDSCILYLDTSGTPISKRGYRVVTHAAPLSELLAAAIIRASGWKTDTHFINPMCGSGTLIIEAALLATNTPSQFLRSSFAFMHLQNFQEDEWIALRTDAMTQIVPAPTSLRIATDRDSGAIRAARKNAQTAGLLDCVDIHVSDFRQTTVPEGDGIVILNPEYGERLGSETELERVYKSIGDWFKERCQGKKGYIFTGNMQLAKTVGLKTSRKIPFYNADIECRLLEFEMYHGSRRPPREEQTE